MELHCCEAGIDGRLPFGGKAHYSASPFNFAPEEILARHDRDSELEGNIRFAGARLTSNENNAAVGNRIPH
jgi:hypothetical protein